MARNAVMIMAAEIQVIAMAAVLCARLQKINQIKRFAIKNSFAFWANVLAQFALHTGSSHANASQEREIRKQNHVSCAVKSPAKINHA
jgi:hypothetical protein